MLDAVEDLARVVRDREGARLLEADDLAVGDGAVDDLEELLVVRALAEQALLVERGQDARHQGEARRARLEGGVVDLDALRLEQPPLRREDGLVELLLQHLVDVVDAELLERVGLQLLEAEDVEDADHAGALGPARHLVDVRHQLVEERAVDDARELRRARASPPCR